MEPLNLAADSLVCRAGLGDPARRTPTRAMIVLDYGPARHAHPDKLNILSYAFGHGSVTISVIGARAITSP